MSITLQTLTVLLCLKLMLMASAIARVLPEFQKKLELNFTEMYNEEELHCCISPLEIGILRKNRLFFF